MSYHVETTDRFDKEFKKLDRYTQRMIRGEIRNLLGWARKSTPALERLTVNKSGQRLNRGALARPRGWRLRNSADISQKNAGAVLSFYKSPDTIWKIPSIYAIIHWSCPYCRVKDNR